MKNEKILKNNSKNEKKKNRGKGGKETKSWIRKISKLKKNIEDK